MIQQKHSSELQPAYCYTQYCGNVPYYSELPKLKFLKKDDYRFSSDLYHKHCNLNSPLNRCYISSIPNSQLFEKRQYEKNEKLDYFFMRGYKKILNQELQKNYEKYGYESHREIRNEYTQGDDPFQTERKRNDKQFEIFLEQERSIETERKHVTRNLLHQSRTERKLKNFYEDNFNERRMAGEKMQHSKRFLF